MVKSSSDPSIERTMSIALCSASLYSRLLSSSTSRFGTLRDRRRPMWARPRLLREDVECRARGESVSDVAVYSAPPGERDRERDFDPDPDLDFPRLISFRDLDTVRITNDPSEWLSDIDADPAVDTTDVAAVEFDRDENFARLSLPDVLFVFVCIVVPVMCVLAVPRLIVDFVRRCRKLLLLMLPKGSPLEEPGSAPKRLREITSRLNMWARERAPPEGVAGREIAFVLNLKRPYWWTAFS